MSRIHNPHINLSHKSHPPEPMQAKDEVAQWAGEAGPDALPEPAQEAATEPVMPDVHHGLLLLDSNLEADGGFILVRSSSHIPERSEGKEGRIGMNIKTFKSTLASSPACSSTKIAQTKSVMVTTLMMRMRNPNRE